MYPGLRFRENGKGSYPKCEGGTAVGGIRGEEGGRGGESLCKGEPVTR